MKIAVLTVTRDRLEYTQHCFASLRANAGCEFHHYVFDNGSTDGTWEWLREEGEAFVEPRPFKALKQSKTNQGICAGLNALLSLALSLEDYDVIVKFDNDCELTTPNTLRDVCEQALDHPALLSPVIHGLRNPPQTIGRSDDILVKDVIGGIFLAAPATVFTDWNYRHDETNPVWGGDDYSLCRWWQQGGGIVGYLDGYHANHYLTTEGQVADIPEYFQRRVLEGGPAR